MNLYAQAEGLKAAEEYLPKFEEAYQASLQMPDLGDYDAWVRTKDGRASNVGGWLFNRAERAITGKTQADVDNELIDAVNNKDTITSKEEFSGKEGDIRVVRSNDGTSYEIQGRTSEGWAKTSLTLNTE